MKKRRIVIPPKPNWFLSRILFTPSERHVQKCSDYPEWIHLPDVAKIPRPAPASSLKQTLLFLHFLKRPVGSSLVVHCAAFQLKDLVWRRSGRQPSLLECASCFSTAIFSQITLQPACCCLTSLSP